MSNKTLVESLSLAQVAICAGIVWVAIGFATNVVGVVYAQCANTTVRANSPCLTQASTCTKVYGVCSSQGTDVHKDKFQCDDPKSGVTCKGSGKMAPCFDRYSCIMDEQENCVADTDKEIASEDKETKQETACVY